MYIKLMFEKLLATPQPSPLDPAVLGVGGAPRGQAAALVALGVVRKLDAAEKKAGGGGLMMRIASCYDAVSHRIACMACHRAAARRDEVGTNGHETAKTNGNLM